jgi:RNA polymerase sigma-70 factor, ECF subfamily
MDLGTPAHFEKAYDEHARGVYAVALRVLGDPVMAQDVAQDVFLRLWRRPGTFDPRRGELGTYLRLMARSRAIDLLREGQAAGRMSDRLQAVEASAPEARAELRPAEIVERDEWRAAVRAALRRLPVSQREALVQAYWRGQTADEIARATEVPLGTAKSRLRLGLERMRRDVEVDALGAA